jgi:energy-converting hydrogenase Eha subunit A
MKSDVAEFDAKEKEGGIRRSFQSNAAFVTGVISFAWQMMWVVVVFLNRESFAMSWPSGWVLYFLFPLPIIVLGIVLGVLGAINKLKKDRAFSQWGIALNCVAAIPAFFSASLLFSI